MKVILIFILCASAFLFSCDPIGGPRIVSHYKYDIILVLEFEYQGIIKTESLVLHPNIGYWPGARHVERRNIIKIEIQTMERKVLQAYSRIEIEEMRSRIEKGKHIESWAISESGLALED